MSEQRPGPQSWQVPGGQAGFVPLQGPGVSARYRRWAGILFWLGIGIAVLMVVALVVSFILLAVADSDVDNAAYGYLAIFVWFGIFAAIPAALAVIIPAVIMRRRVRQAGPAPS